MTMIYFDFIKSFDDFHYQNFYGKCWWLDWYQKWEFIKTSVTVLTHRPLNEAEIVIKRTCVLYVVIKRLKDRMSKDYDNNLHETSA